MEMWCFLNPYSMFGKPKYECHVFNFIQKFLVFLFLLFFFFSNLSLTCDELSWKHRCALVVESGESSV